MKLTKVSLVALVALGAFSSVASATPLEEAIKNVDLSGFARYRYTNDHYKNSAQLDTKRSSIGNHTFKMQTAFKAAIDDNFFGVLNLRYQANDGSGDNAGRNFSNRYDYVNNNGTDKTNTTNSFGVYEMYLGYKIGNTTVTAGKQKLGTFYDGKDIAGTGIKVVNTDISGLTLTALALDALENEKSDTNGPLANTLVASNMFSDSPANIYYLAAFGSYEPLAFKIAIANISEVATLYGVDAGVSFNVTDDINLNLKGQFAHNDSDHKDVADANFRAIQAGTKLFGANFNTGYLDFDAKNKADDVKNSNKISFVTLDGNGDLISPAKILNGGMSGSRQYYNNIKGNNDYWFVNGGYSIDKFGFGAGYTQGKGTSYTLNKERAKRNEWYAQASYKYSKKLNFLTWYAAAKDKKDSESYKQDRIRFEAKYSF
ncbi:major outer membrane protein [Campylobacter concisus]|uniref:major outer membrane protein n=1 Tax=Campylobacter concisus TaxID=199 RepID=UPI0018AB7674|nr:major outer membrane protein [Campylobacter concisus]QPH99712.1 major outer membrane protein [Campylobacter concisus]QPI01506.1 major outer membrane protein [Campylobacter concisus]